MSSMMDAYRWKNRPLVVFAPSGDDDRYHTQIGNLRQMGEEFADRDMVVIHGFGGTGRGAVQSSVESFSGGEWQRQPIAPGAEQELRDRYGSGSEFEVILVGKDGGVKLRSDEPVAAEELFALIDSMPMRRREMQE
jgi:hypothetical protein